MHPRTRAQNIITIIVPLGIVISLAAVWLTAATARERQVSVGGIESVDVSALDIAWGLLFPACDEMLSHKINADTGVSEITEIPMPPTNG